MIIWDLWIRVIHWVIAFTILANWFFFEGGDQLHLVAGYGSVIFVGFRVILGFFGSFHAQFRHFPIHELPQMLRFSKDWDGHNPLASIIYYLIWSLIVALGVTGFMMSLDMFWGEEWLEMLHHNIARTLIGLVVLHLLGTIMDSIRYRRPTILAMIRGKRY